MAAPTSCSARPGSTWAMPTSSARAATATTCYFATPHHSWERGSNENANGLMRQYWKKGVSMAHLTQRECHRIADKLNRRPRKRPGFRTPEEVYAA